MYLTTKNTVKQTYFVRSVLFKTKTMVNISRLNLVHVIVKMKLEPSMTKIMLHVLCVLIKVMSST